MSYFAETVVTNSDKKFKDNFSNTGVSQPDVNTWDLVNPTGAHIITQGGNAAGSSYLRLSLSPFDADSEVTITSKEIFQQPFRMEYGVSTSQRIFGQEVGMEVVGIDGSGTVETITPIADIAMPASVTVATANVLPIVTATAHGLHGGDRIVIYGCLDSRVNCGPFPVTIITSTSFSIAATIAVATYTTTGGFIKIADPFSYAKNAASWLAENTTVTNSSAVTRRDGGPFRTTNTAINTLTAGQSNTSPYTDAFNSAANQEIYLTPEELIFRSYSADSVSVGPSISKYSQGLPDEKIGYKIRLRAKNLKNLTVPVARITTCTKSATTTATFNTDVPHGLTTSDFVQVYGVRDQGTTFFPNLSTAVVVTGTPTPTSFTCICGTAGTTNSTGGVVWRVQGGVTAPGVVAGSIQSISRTNNILTVINGSTWATPLPGEYYQLWGMDAGGAAYDGAYKVLRVSTTTLELESTGPDFGSINCGGAGFKRTDVRFHYVRLLDYTKLVAEIVGGKGNTSDLSNAVPVNVVSMGASTTGPAKSRTAALGAADMGIPALALRSDSPIIATAGSVNGGYSSIVTDATGRVWIAESPIATRGMWNLNVRNKIS